MAHNPPYNHSGFGGFYNLQKFKQVTKKKIVKIYSDVHKK